MKGAMPASNRKHTPARDRESSPLPQPCRCMTGTYVSLLDGSIIGLIEWKCEADAESLDIRGALAARRRLKRVACLSPLCVGARWVRLSLIDCVPPPISSRAKKACPSPKPKRPAGTGQLGNGSAGGAGCHLPSIASPRPRSRRLLQPSSTWLHAIRRHGTARDAKTRARLDL